MKERKPSKVYLAGSGEYGCLYDCVSPHRNRDDAIKALIERFDMAHTRLAGTLRRDGSVALRRGMGASYCEVVEGDVNEWWDAERGEFKENY